MAKLTKKQKEAASKIEKNKLYSLKDASIISINKLFILKYLNNLRLVRFKYYNIFKDLNNKNKKKNYKLILKKKKRIFYYSLKQLIIIQTIKKIKYIYFKPKFNELDGRVLFN